MESRLFHFKIDADTLLHPHFLRPLLTSLAPLARAPNDLYLGLASCRSPNLPSLCHAAGGAGYALNRAAVATLARFVRAGALDDATWLAHLDNLTYGGEDVAVALALKETSGAAVLNVGGFHQHPPEK